MAMNDELLEAAIDRIAAIEGLYMAPEALVEDVVLLAKVWPDEQDFLAAVASSARALEQICSDKVTPSPLENDLSGWLSYHYQLRRRQGFPASLRIIYRPVSGGIEVKGFGHRFKPASIYHRIVHGERN